MCLAAKTFIWPRLQGLKCPGGNGSVIWDEAERHLWRPGWHMMSCCTPSAGVRLGSARTGTWYRFQLGWRLLKQNNNSYGRFLSLRKRGDEQQLQWATGRLAVLSLSCTNVRSSQSSSRCYEIEIKPRSMNNKYNNTNMWVFQYERDTDNDDLFSNIVDRYGWDLPFSLITFITLVFTWGICVSTPSL